MNRTWPPSNRAGFPFLGASLHFPGVLLMGKSFFKGTEHTQAGCKGA